MINELLNQLKWAYTNPSCIETEKAKGYYDAIKDLQQENQQLKEDIKAYEQERNNLINSIPFKENKKLKTNWNELKKYIDNNKMILNNPHIFQYYLIQEEILKGDNNE